MTYAIIDLGTNTFNLLIAEAALHVNGNDAVCEPFFKKLFGTKEVVKLGEGGITRQFIAEIPFKRGIEALLKHKQTIEEYKADKTFAFATSAIRDAKNGGDFARQAEEKTGIKINIISGEKEAELIYFGVRQALDLGNEKSLTMDIGGGSAEFIIANRNEIFWKQSFQLGVSRLLEKFKPSDPIKKSEIKIMEEYFAQELQPLLFQISNFKFQILNPEPPIPNLIGSSGSFDSFADMIAHKYYFPKMLKGKTTYNFNKNELAAIHRKILKSSIHERLQMKGLVPFRADNIVIASILTQFIINKLNIKNIKLSKYALKEGVLWAILNGRI